MHHKLEIAQHVAAELGEGPTWDPVTEQLVWVDIVGCKVHRFDPRSGIDATFQTPQHVGAAKPRTNGGLVVNLRDGVGLYDTDNGFRWLARWPEEGCRGNDAAVDSHGQLWAGTMRYDEGIGGGKLRRVSGAGEVVTVLDQVTVSNGIGWSPDGRLMYYIDTPTRRIDVFEVDTATGLATNRHVFVTLDSRTEGSPDGLTVDADGCVWVALWGGHAVRRYTPEGHLDRVIDLPVSHPTACTFGGPELRDLYITTATVALDEHTRAQQPLAGCLLVLPTAGIGHPGHTFAG